MFPFPQGFDFPANAEQLEQAVTIRDQKPLRRHGWFLWAGLNDLAPNGLPVWRTWPTSTQAYAPPVGVAQAAITPQRSLIAARNANNPIVLPAPHYRVPKPIKDKYGIDQLADGPVFQFNGDIMIVNVVYNSDAFEYLRSTGLFEGAALDRLKAEGVKEIPPFVPTSIVLKHMYWPVRGDGLTALPVWDPIPPIEPPVYYGYERWERLVAVDPSGQLIPAGTEATVTYLYDVFEPDKTTPLGPVTKTGKVVPISAFYHQRFTQADLDALTPADRAILDAAAYWNYGRLFEVGDYIISIALHINTKELPYWTLQSLWWHDQPDGAPMPPIVRTSRLRRRRGPGATICWSASTASPRSLAAASCPLSTIPISNWPRLTPSPRTVATATSAPPGRAQAWGPLRRRTWPRAAPGNSPC